MQAVQLGFKFTSPLQWLIFLAASALCITTVCHHEMWRDESQAWLIARDSKTLAELWNNVRYEGHPALWHFILHVANVIAPSAYTIQVIHVTIGLATLSLVIFYSPFSLVEKLLLSFSYFLSYEYLVISRNYGIGIFLLLLSIILFLQSKSKTKRMLWMAVLLGLAANSNVYALIISVCLFLYFIFSRFQVFTSATYRSYYFYAASFVFFVFIVTAVLQLKAPADRIPVIKFKPITQEKVEKLSSKVSATLLYLPDLNSEESFWNSYEFRNRNLIWKPVIYIFLLFMMLLLCLIIFSCWKYKKLLLFFLFSFFSLLLFSLLLFDTEYIRHQGHFFVLLVITLWLLQSQAKLTVALRSAFMLILLFQFSAGLIAHSKDIQHRFSNGKAAAGYLAETGRNNQGILMNPDFTGLSVLHYGNIKQAYYPVIKSYGSFVKFRKGRKWYPLEVMMKDADSLKLQTLIFNAALHDTMAVKYGYRLLYTSAKPASVKDEFFYIYGKQ